ncbi:hypothetical protein OIE66_18190 [Nonomuraea sp. NBC_01738]|uniref:hypothetical protein n=1 Tax=Nonomuraea sp. NBC_01738 TaxID=2976003 RepID=UPI002E122220|nr:hypothetical protein OIE66_18190 [Nonomuraea sp. NBC_01738]
MSRDLRLGRLVVAAAQAPSVHNTQLWRFDVADEEFVRLFADRERQLRVCDPRGRSLHISCGAALFDLRLAAGGHPEVRLLPEPEDEPDLLATVRLGPHARPEHRDLCHLVRERRTNRQPFADRRIPPAVLAALRTAAAGEGTGFEAHPQLAVLTTRGDGPLDWLRAGQALQRLLLVATGHGLSAFFLNQPLDLRDMRGRSDPRDRRAHSQMIIRLGYVPPVPRTPRRPVTELELTHA